MDGESSHWQSHHILYLFIGQSILKVIYIIDLSNHSLMKKSVKLFGFCLSCDESRRMWNLGIKVTIWQPQPKLFVYNLIFQTIVYQDASYLVCRYRMLRSFCLSCVLWPWVFSLFSNCLRKHKLFFRDVKYLLMNNMITLCGVVVSCKVCMAACQEYGALASFQRSEVKV